MTLTAPPGRNTRDYLSFGPLRIGFDDQVLRPRPWTAMQSVWAADLAAHVPAGPILELCAGAGHIGLLATALSGRPLVQVDCSPVACQFARTNARENGLGHLVEVRCASLDDSPRSGELFPLIIADPPYVPTAGVGRFPEDPVVAIDGGQDGLAVVRQCVEVARHHLAEGGVCLLQLADLDQARAVRTQASTSSLIADEARAAPGRGAVVLIGRSDCVTSDGRARTGR